MKTEKPEREPIYRQQLPVFTKCTLHVGITGHRDVANKDEVLPLLIKELRSLTRHYSLKEIVIHTPLAKGADQWIVEASKGISPTVKHTIQVILPMSRKDYLASITDDQEREEIQSLINDHGKRLRIHNHAPIKDDDDLTQRYADLADYFAQNCDLMLCLWDGVRNHKKGGTGDIFDRLISPSKKKTKALLTLSVARESNIYTTQEPFTWQTHKPKPVKKAPFINFRKWLLPSIFFFGFMTILLGTVGYCKVEGLCGSNAFIISVSHLILNSLDVLKGDQALNATIIVSRYSGLIFFTLTASALIEKILNLCTSLKRSIVSKQDHDLICGLGWRGQTLLDDHESYGTPVISIDARPDPSAIGLSTLRKTPLLKQDARQLEVLKTTGLIRTKRAFICTGSDEINMEIVHKLASYQPTESELYWQKQRASMYRFFSKLKKHLNPIYWHKRLSSPQQSELIENDTEYNPIICSVGLERKENFDTLRKSLPENHNLDLRIFNTEYTTARLFLRNNQLDRFTNSPRSEGARVVIIGSSPMAEALTNLVIQQGIYEDGKKLELFRLVPNAKDAASAMQEQHPCYALEVNGTTLTAANPIWKENVVLPDIHYHELPQSSRGLINWAEKELDDTRWVLTVIIAQSDPAKSVESATAVAPALTQLRTKKERDIALWFLFNTPNDAMRHDIERNLDIAHPHLHIRAFSDFLGVCNRYHATGEEADAIARRVNAAYCEIPLFDQGKIEVEWKGLSEENKDSSRQSAEHCFVKARIENRLRKSSKKISEEEIINALSIIEHRRWCTDHLLRGFQPLTKIPSEGPYLKTSDEDSDKIDQWFSGDKKKSFQKYLLHVDLVPFQDFDILFEGKYAPEKKKETEESKLAADTIKQPEERIPLAELEKKKDIVIVDNLHCIINGAI